jgi:hypothetical protein
MDYERRNKMPTGYTYYIEKGEVNTGKDFLLKCARGFGACIDMRDESLDVDIPVELKPSTYHKEQLEKAYKDLEKYKSMTIEEAQKIVDEKYIKSIEDTKKAITDYYEKKEKYDKVREEIDNWEPPTHDHIKLKEFALDQIKISTEYDHIEYYNDELTKPKKTPEEYITCMIEGAADSIKYHLKCWNEEVQRTDERNKWINDLRESLKDR